jgi:hypothetical protein
VLAAHEAIDLVVMFRGKCGLYSSRVVIVGARMLDRRRWMMGELILDELVPKPQHNTATSFGRGNHGKHRALSGGSPGRAADA